MSQPQQKNDYVEKLTTLAQQAISDISNLSFPVIQFCGPISTGGFGNTTENIDCLISVINFAKKRGFSVFDQISYERRLDRILGKHDGYDYPILDYFYKPIYSSGKINGVVFLPLWQSSIGSNWEHEYAKTLGIPIFYIENMTSSEIDNIYKILKK